jgi:hypothetical protein
MKNNLTLTPSVAGRCDQQRERPMTTPLRLNQTRYVRHSRGTVWRALLMTLALTSWAVHAEFPQDQADAERKAAKDAETKRQAEWKRKYNEAKPIFDKLCAEQSQAIIKRTVEDVEGVLLLKVRGAAGYVTDKEKNRPDWPGAALPSFGWLTKGSSGGSAEQFLFDWHWQKRTWGNPPVEVQIWESRSSVGGQTAEVWQANLNYVVGSDNYGKSVRKKLFNGYRYVDVVLPDQDVRERITAQNDQSRRDHPYPGLVFTRELTRNPAPRYGVTFEDNVDSELRKHWIAGTTVSVVDVKTKEVIAQQSFWAWDQGFGATGQVVPWSTNTTRCPPRQNPMTLVHSALKAKQGN